LRILRVILAPCVFLSLAARAALIVLVDTFRKFSGHSVEELVSDMSKNTVFVCWNCLEFQLRLWNRICLTILVYEVEVLGYVLDVLYGFGDLASHWHVSHVYSFESSVRWAKKLFRSITLTLLRFVWLAQKSSLINRFLIKSADSIFTLFRLIPLNYQGLGEESLSIDFGALETSLTIVLSRCALSARNWRWVEVLALSLGLHGIFY